MDGPSGPAGRPVLRVQRRLGAIRSDEEDAGAMTVGHAPEGCVADAAHAPRVSARVCADRRKPVSNLSPRAARTHREAWVHEPTAKPGCTNPPRSLGARTYRDPFRNNTTCTVSSKIIRSRNSEWFLT